jgi:hypothetical protein
MFYVCFVSACLVATEAIERLRRIAEASIAPAPTTLVVVGSRNQRPGVKSGFCSP